MSSLVLWGPERLLNSASPNGEVTPSIEAFPDGSYVAVWALGLANFGPDTDGAVYARLFNADGTPKGPEFLVNSTTLRVQKAPQVTILNSGRFVVTWEDNSQDGTVGTQIRAQIFNADGSVFDRDGDGLKNEQDFVINTIAAGNQVSPTATALSNGGFAVAYRSPQGFDDDILAQAFDADGNKLGSEITVNLTTANPQRDPVVAGLSGNRYVALWVDSGPADDVGAITTIRGRILSADGTSGGTEFLVPSSRGSKQEISVTELANGKFIVSWTHFAGFDGHGGSDGSSSSIKAQIFNADGTLYRSEFLVNTPTLNFQKTSSITALPDGGFAIAYIDTSTGQSHVRVALFDQEGGRSLADIFVGPPSGSTVGTRAVITTLADGRLFVTWDENGTSRADDVSSIRGQIVDPRSAAVNLAGTASADDFYGTVYNDMLGSGEGADKLTGDLGNDTLNGGKGADVLNGGRAGVAVGSDGVDFASYVNAETGVVASLLANASNTGEAAGDIYISIEGLIGSAHADRLSGDNNANTISGGDNDQLFGNDGADLLEGGEGDDVLDGGLGADILQGGKGDDTYIVDNALDKVEELAGEGTDIVTASVSYSLDLNTEVEELHAKAGLDSINLTGSNIGNKLYGNDGGNKLNGGAGADTLEGGLGDDIYVLDEAGDVVIEAAGNGTGYDTIEIANNFGSGTYRISDFANIEALQALDGAGGVILIGDAIANKLTGNSSDNTLEGGQGNDTLDGAGGMNTAFFTGAKADYIITRNAADGTITIADKISGRDGTDQLKNIKYARFSDGTVDLLQALPTLSIAATDAAKAEGETGIKEYFFTITRSSGSGVSTVEWSLTGLGVAGAASADDFDPITGTSGSVRFEDGETERVVSIKVRGDKEIEGHETFTIALLNPKDATLATASATGTIINDDALPNLSIAAVDAAKDEGNTGFTNYTFTVTRSSNSGISTATWKVSGVGANAASDDDFDLVTDTVRFEDGEWSKTITVKVKTDTIDESDETFSIVLSNANGATIITDTAYGTITNDDTPINTAPANIRFANGGTAVWVDENKSVGALIATVVADDNGGASGLRYSMTHDAFEIDAITGQIRVKAGAVLDYESGGSYKVTVTATDLDGSGLATTRDLDINLNDIGEKATGINFTKIKDLQLGVSGVGAEVALATAVDLEATGATANLYRFDNGQSTTPDGLFVINANTGQITTTRALTASDVGVKTLNVVAYDAVNPSLYTVQSHAVTILSENNAAPYELALSKQSIDENSLPETVVATLSALDAQGASDIKNFEIVGDPDGKFKIVGNELRLKAGIDHEAQGSHQVTIRVWDKAGNFFDKAFTIAINDVNEKAKGINFKDVHILKVGESGKYAQVAVAEAEDLDPTVGFATSMYQFDTGLTSADGLFVINAYTGEITTTRAVTAADVGTKKLSVITYDASNPTLFFAKSHTVAIAPQDNRAPSVTDVVASGKGEDGAGADAGTFVIFENEGAGVVADVNASDNDGDMLTYSLAGANGTYNGLFSIAADGKISITDPAALNLNADKDYVLTVQVSDNHGGIDTQDVTIRVKNVAQQVVPNAAPTGLSLSNSFVLEYAAPGATEIGTLSATDANGDALTYALLDTAGGRFALIGNKLMLVGAGVNFEEAKSHQIKVQVSDGKGGAFDQAFVINVGDQLTLNKRGTKKNDKLNGSALDDILKGGTGTGKDTIKGLNGDDKLYGESGDDKVYGGNGFDFVRGDAGNDKVYGDAGNDSVYGGAGDDKVYGDAGNDTVKGDAGNDTVYGGAGNDKLYGGAGKDTFVFNTKASKTANLDQVVDFKVVDDTLWLDNKYFTKLGKAGSEAAPAALNKDFFKVGAINSKVIDRNDYIIYDKKTGILYYDADGSGKKAAVEIAKLSKNLKLTAADFFVI